MDNDMAKKDKTTADEIKAGDQVMANVKGVEGTLCTYVCEEPEQNRHRVLIEAGEDSFETLVRSVEPA